jgi:hypothetical protein
MMDSAKIESDFVEVTQVPTVEAFPEAARAEAGVLLDVDGQDPHSLKLAKDGRVSGTILSSLQNF